MEIPTLKEFFEFAKPTDLKINIELKTGVIYYDGLEEKTFRMAEDFSMNDRIIYSSFNHYSLQKLKKLYPDAKIGLLMGEDYARLEDVKRFGACAVHPPESIVTKEYVDKWHESGAKVHAWTIDNPKRMREIVKTGVDAFITDCPDSGRKAADG